MVSFTKCCKVTIWSQLELTHTRNIVRDWFNWIDELSVILIILISLFRQTFIKDVFTEIDEKIT